MKLDDSQRHFVVAWCIKYIEGTDFDGGVVMVEISHLLKVEKQLLSRKISGLPLQIPSVENLQNSLKYILLKELERLPEYFEGLEPKERLDIICKLIPFVLPKIHPIDLEIGEW